VPHLNGGGAPLYGRTQFEVATRPVYSVGMGSVLDDLRSEQFASHAAMTPEARLRLADRLGAEALASLMAAQGLDRSAAVAATRRTRRFGRKPCKCLDEDR
jgi:hypothetical protein